MRWLYVPWQYYPNKDMVAGRFIGVISGRIQAISDAEFTNEEMDILPLPDELKDLPSEELMLNYRLVEGKLVSLKEKAKNPRVAFVSNFAMRCGISTYAESLYPEIIKEIDDFCLFIEKNDDPTQDILNIGGQVYPGKIIPCWKRGEPLGELIAALKAFNPDVILIQHEFGIFPNARYWMAMMTQLSKYRVIVTHHSVFIGHLDKTIVEATDREIIVHSEPAKQALISKGLSSKIYVIPHGCYPLSGTKLWNFYKSEHTLVQVGFGFRYKNFQASIETCALLRQKYSDVFLTLIFSESDHNRIAHEQYYNELIELISQLELEEHVAIIRGYQTDKVMDSYFGTNKIALFPYQSEKEHFVYGSSGAARKALAAMLPTISSNINHFQDLPTIKAETPQEMAEAADLLFSNQATYDEQVARQNAFVIENSWEKIAKKYIAVMCGN
jgi:hypothetical protein